METKTDSADDDWLFFRHQKEKSQQLVKVAMDYIIHNVFASLKTCVSKINNPCDYYSFKENNLDMPS